MIPQRSHDVYLTYWYIYMLYYIKGSGFYENMAHSRQIVFY